METSTVNFKNIVVMRHFFCQLFFTYSLIVSCGDSIEENTNAQLVETKESWSELEISQFEDICLDQKLLDTVPNLSDLCKCPINNLINSLEFETFELEITNKILSDTTIEVVENCPESEVSDFEHTPTTEDVIITESKAEKVLPPIKLINSLPSNGEINVDIRTMIELEYDLDIKESSVNNNSFKLNDSEVETNLTISASGKKIICTLTSPLKHSTTYTLSQENSITGQNGEAVNSTSITFTTRDLQWTEVVPVAPIQEDQDFKLGTRSVGVLDGILSVAFYKSDNTYKYIQMSQYTNGSWSSPETLVTFDSTNAGNLMFSTNSSGDGVILWREKSDSIYNLYAKRYENGKWKGSYKLNVNSEQAEYSDISIDSNGTAIAIWNQVDTNDNYSIFASLQTRGGYWNIGSEIELMSGVATRPKVKFDSSNRGLVSWTHVPSFTPYIYITKYTPSNGWDMTYAKVENSASDYSTIDTGNYMSFATGYTDTDSNFRIYAYRNYGFSNVGPVTVDSLDTKTYSRSICFDGKDNLYAVWGQNSTLYFSSLGIDKNTFTSPVNLGTLDFFDTISITCSKNLGAHVAWISSDGVITTASLVPELDNIEPFKIWEDKDDIFLFPIALRVHLNDLDHPTIIWQVAKPDDYDYGIYSRSFE